MKIYLNDKFVPREQANISVFDHGFLYGDGVYETLRTYQGKFFQLHRHLERLRRSCDLIHLPMPKDEGQWVEILNDALRRNELEHGDASIRITISRGEGEIGLDPALCAHPTVVVMAKPFLPVSREIREKGVQLTMGTIRRSSASAQPPEIKSLSFLNNILAKHEAIEAGCADAIMLNGDGFLTECTTSNVFFVRENTLYTPAFECGILQGVTREIVLTLSREHGIEVIEGFFSPQQLFDADECFMTNTNVEVMPVCQIGSRRIGEVCPGLMTRRVERLFKQNIDRFLDG